MDAVAFVAQLRDHYVDQFRGFAEQQRASCAKGSSEVKLRLGEDSELFDRLYCADFVKNDGQAEIIELNPDRALAFSPISGSFGDASLSIEHLRWDDVLLHHDSETLPQQELSRWFQRWFDPEDERQESSAELSRVIHSMLVRPGAVSIDFGTAEPEAFWAMLQLLEGAGARSIQVSSSKAAMPDVN
jgi:hypothetical protein